MSLQEDFAKRAERIQDYVLGLAADFLATHPLGSFVSIEQFNAILRGNRVDFLELQDYMMGDEPQKSFWVLKKNNRVVGFFIITAEAMKAYAKIPNGG